VFLAMAFSDFMTNQKIIRPPGGEIDSFFGISPPCRIQSSSEMISRSSPLEIEMPSLFLSSHSSPCSIQSSSGLLLLYICGRLVVTGPDHLLKRVMTKPTTVDCGFAIVHSHQIVTPLAWSGVPFCSHLALSLPYVCCKRMTIHR
jgi:hypothetical protein